MTSKVIGFRVMELYRVCSRRNESMHWEEGRYGSTNANGSNGLQDGRW